MPFPAHNYYHQSEKEFLELVIPPGQEILLISSDDEKIPNFPAKGRVVLSTIDQHPGTSPEYERHSGYQLESVKGKFDYIILQHCLSLCDDIGSFVLKLATFCKPSTRIIVCTHNYLWKPLLWLGSNLKLKRPGGTKIMLSGTDINNIMSSMGFQLVISRRTMFFPIFALGIGPIINGIGKFLPFLDWLKINLFQIYRPLFNVSRDETKESLTVCLTCRDEKDNIEPLVKAIPRIAAHQEILFVEGHSIDETLEEIYRVQEIYPDKNIRVIRQAGKGQGDAIREGFSKAKGCIIILLEADMTSPPENIKYVYESLRHRHVEFIEGSRFVYPISRQAMPYLNKFGNWCFSLFFSFLFWRQMTDVLSGIKAIRKEDFEKILARWNSWGIDDPFGDFELLFGAMRLGLMTGEQPIHYSPRPYGRSKTRSFYHGYLLFKMSINAFWKFRG